MGDSPARDLDPGSKKTNNNKGSQTSPPPCFASERPKNVAGAVYPFSIRARGPCEWSVARTVHLTLFRVLD
jgi:hypothetical protein